MTDFALSLSVCLQQWPMYMVDYSGVNVQVPGKVNYWRTTVDCSKGTTEEFVTEIFTTLPHATLTLCQSATTEQTENRELKVWMTSWVLRTTECMRIKWSQGRSSLSVCCLHATPAGQLSLFVPVMTEILFFYAAEDFLQPCFCPCPSTHHAVGFSNVLLTKTMSLITTWFHNIQIFVLFIYYIYWNITLCAGM